MPKKYPKVKGGGFVDVAASSSDPVLFPIVANGQTAHLRRLGCVTESGQQHVVIEWGKAGDWQMVLPMTGYVHERFDEDFEGDGTKRFRVRNINEGSNTSKMWHMIDYIEKAT